MYTPSKSICEPFILNENNILRIVDIIEKRRPTDVSEKYSPIFCYKRLDDYEHETNDISVLLSEDNRGNVRIVSLTIQNDDFLFSSEKLNYKITFNSYENLDESDLGLSFFDSIDIAVKGEDRDVAELLFNDLENYIKNAVVSVKYKKIIKLLKLFESPFTYGLMLFFVLPIIFLSSITDDSYKINKTISDALSSDSIQQKLDAILIYFQNNSRFDYFHYIPIFLLIFLFLILFLLRFNKNIQKRLHSLYPFIFDFGVCVESYKVRTRTLVFIASIIGTLILGVVGDFLYDVIVRLI